MSWQCNFSKSLCEVLHDLYSFEHKSSLKNQLKQKAEVDEFLKNGMDVAEKWAKVIKMRKDEHDSSEKTKAGADVIVGMGASHSPINRLLQLNRSNSGDETQSATVRFETWKLQ